MFTPPAIRRILVPMDFSEEADAAFAHALRLALAFEAELDLLHVEPENAPSDWRAAPRVVETLKRWGYLEAGATEDALAGLRIRARRTLAAGQAPDRAILEEIAAFHADLVVMAMHGRTGLSRWLEPSVTEGVVRSRPVPLLVLPPAVPGFIGREWGDTRLSRVLVPIDTTPHPAPGFDAACLLLRALGGERPQLATLHVGEGHPGLDLLPPAEGWEVYHWNAEGPVVDAILELAGTWSSDLVVVVSEGRRAFLDEVRGSTVERLLRRATTPILVVPSDWGARDVA